MKFRNATLFAAGTVALLATAASAKTWTGTGKMYDAERRLQGEYSMVVEEITISPKVSRVSTEIRADGEIVHTSQCRLEKGNNQWKKRCHDGTQGGGYFFDYGLAQEYVERPDGSAVATHIVLDGDDHMRLSHTVLRDDEPQEYFAGTLERQRVNEAD